MTAKPQILHQNSSPHNITASAPSTQQHAPAESLRFENVLSSCVYIGLQCSRCGEVRQALSQLPQSQETVCPECGGASSFFVLGSGLTSRSLPFHERILEQSIFSPLRQQMSRDNFG